MREIDLNEHTDSCPIRLTDEELDAVQRNELSISVRPALGEIGKFILRPGSTVGVSEFDGLSILIRPKMPIQNLISLACYALGVVKSREIRQFEFKDAEELPDMLALALATAALRTFTRGLLHDYQTEEEALYGVRGRIRFNDQIRRRYGLPLPVEVQYDEFTDDILANRLVKAAATKLGYMQLRYPPARQRLEQVSAILDDIALVEFEPNNVPSVTFNPLNEHYRVVVELSRVVLQHSAFRSERGSVRTSSFLFDMNRLFQDFVTEALREALGVSERTFRPAKKGRYGDGIYLDAEESLTLEPDLTWWDGGVCTFVGDVKYKYIRNENVPNADVYQLFAYATALKLPHGLLIYASGETEPIVHTIKHASKDLKVVTLDLSGTIDQVLGEIQGVAKTIDALRHVA